MSDEVFRRLSEFEPLQVDWLWEPYIPIGMITILEGDPNLGKSYLAMHIAAEVTKGGNLPKDQALSLGRVLYFSAEALDYTV